MREGGGGGLKGIGACLTNLTVSQKKQKQEELIY